MARLPSLRAYPFGRNWLYDIRRFAGPNKIKICFDVGANIGQTAWGLTRYFPNSEIYCFEPAPATFEILEKRYSGKIGLKLIGSALGDADGVIDMAVHENSEYNTLAAPSWRTENATTSIKIMRLDDFSKRNSVAFIDLLKLDVQGWEPDVLRGAHNIISSRRIRFILCEVGFDGMQPDMVYFDEIHRHLSKYGYSFCGMYDQYRWGDKRSVYFANALYALVAED